MSSTIYRALGALQDEGEPLQPFDCRSEVCRRDPLGGGDWKESLHYSRCPSAISDIAAHLTVVPEMILHILQQRVNPSLTTREVLVLVCEKKLVDVTLVEPKELRQRGVGAGDVYVLLCFWQQSAKGAARLLISAFEKVPRMCHPIKQVFRAAFSLSGESPLCFF
jgi:hypothetical protein